ncbi:conjugative transfer pilus assembly protein TraH [Vibrio crassostreae]|uniref:conjugal transfer protein TraH n=1 Tax=Vibrio crassostreae TaxID=246167 RepID=UPI000F46941C|nr:conjugal transfer protein TraH [Vibrio crassostreae]ROO49071.1 conjugative transfer pilus assembly protein TraH [Vibrio crassostreae]CAK3389124.1 conjugative transfer pilus assembly protein TraH [Vibrio crassostreae]
MKRSLFHHLSTVSVHKWVIPLFLINLSSASHADTNHSLARFFDDSGYNANVSNPTAYQGQSANYYTGGSLFVRNKIVEAQLVSVTVPSISAGCSGIDMFMGGFSHINSDQLVRAGKAIIHNAPPFIVNLALQTWAPQLKQNLDNLQAIADKYLNQSVNSCEAAQASIGGLAAFAAPATKKHVCATLGTQNNAFSDWVQGQQECGAGGKADGQLANAKNDPALKDMTQTHHNVVWSAIMNNAFLSSDKNLAQFMMSLSGTYVYDKDGNPRYYPSLLTDNNNLVNVLLEGGQADVYQCRKTDSDACITLTKRNNLSITQANGIQNQIRTQLESILQKIATDQKLTEKQKGFLELTQTPVLKFFIDDLSANQSPDTGNYSRMIAVELLNQYLVSMLNVASQSLANTNNSQEDITLITRDVDNAKRFTAGLADNAIEALNHRNQLIDSQRKTAQQSTEEISTTTKPVPAYRN